MHLFYFCDYLENAQRKWKHSWCPCPYRRKPLPSWWNLLWWLSLLIVCHRNLLLSGWRCLLPISPKYKWNLEKEEISYWHNMTTKWNIFLKWNMKKNWVKIQSQENGGQTITLILTWWKSRWRPCAPGAAGPSQPMPPLHGPWEHV